MAYLENELRPHRRFVLENDFDKGSTLSSFMNKTKPVYIDMNSCQISPVRGLFLGCSDLSHVLYLIHTSSSVVEWEFHLVDKNPMMMARNFLFLQILNDDTVSIDVLWGIWYDFLLDKNVHSYLHNLIRKINLNQLKFIHEDSRSVIAQVLKEWLTLLETTIKEKACQQRRDHLLYCLETICFVSLEKFIENSCEAVRSVMKDENQSTIDAMKKEIQCYIEHGTMKVITNREYINITMLQSSSGTYNGHYDMYPYQSYLPFGSVEEQDEFRRITNQKTNPLTTYCKQQLEQWVTTYRQHRQKIKCHLWCSDVLTVALFNMPLIEFDLIHTSDLCDHLGMLSLLVICVNLLRNRTWSRIVTQSLKGRTTYPQFTDYLSKLFNNIDRHWFPSLFGLICECIRINEKQDPYEHQLWRLATNTQSEPHLRFDGTDNNIVEMLDKIAERCFCTHLTQPQPSEGLGCSTTFTYYLFLRQYCHRCCVHPNEAFDYLFQRTCDRFRAYAIGLRALRDFFSNTDVFMYTSKNHSSFRKPSLLPSRLQIPLLQIVIIECDEPTLCTLIHTMRADEFKEITETSVAGDQASYSLRTGMITVLSEPEKQIKFHLIDDFVYKSLIKSTGETNDSSEFYLDLTRSYAEVQFILPTLFSSLSQTALLMDFRTWFPIAKFQLINPITSRSKSIANVLSTRDGVSSCYADISDRRIHYPIRQQKSCTIQIINAYETISSFHVLIQIQPKETSWTHTPTLILSEQVLILTMKFSHCTSYSLRLVFACPLNLSQCQFQTNVENGTLNMTLAKKIPELLSLSIVSRQPTSNLFDLTTAKRWPSPRSANGHMLDIRMDLPSPFSIGGYDSETWTVYNALSEMFTPIELRTLSDPSSDEIFRNPHLGLRETIRQMSLNVFCARQRVIIYFNKAGRRFVNMNNVRTIGDIIFLYEGIFNYCNRPVLALSYLDIMEIQDNEVVSLSQYVLNLIRTEMNKYAALLARTRSLYSPLISSSNYVEIVASKKELDLMRQLLIENTAKTKGPHRIDLRGPWHASFLEPLRVESNTQANSLPNFDQCRMS